MKYQIRFSKNHPFEHMRGKKMELFRIKYVYGEWKRDPSGDIGPWGYVHPRDGDIVRLVSVGSGSAPLLGQIHVSYAIEEVVETTDEEFDALEEAWLEEEIAKELASEGKTEEEE